MEHIASLKLKNFRCFADLSLEFKSPVMLIKGPNGSGKTSILEALSYAATLRSFKTHHINDLVSFEQDGFLVKLNFTNLHSLKTVYANKKRVIKFDEKVIKSHREISLLYHTISLTEDDLAIVQSGPEARRNFIDHILVLTSSEYAQQLKDYKKIVEQRNALLQNPNFNKNHYDLWTQELSKKNSLIVAQRLILLEKLNIQVNNILDQYINKIIDKKFVVDLIYEPKNNLDELSELILQQEIKMGRTLVGAHLDDIVINFQDRKSRSFASRGQQKLLVLVLKIVGLQTILQSECKPEMLLFLLDDFLTDLDSRVAFALIKLVASLNVQLFITSPGSSTVIEDAMRQQNILFSEINIG